MAKKFVTVKGIVTLDQYIDVSNGPSLVVPNLKGWIDNGTVGYFLLSKQENSEEYRCVCCLKCKK